MKLLLLRSRLLAVFFLFLGLHRPAVGQTSERRTSLGLIGSGLQYQGDFRSDYWQWPATKPAFGLAINQYLTRGLDLNTQAFYGELTGNRPADTTRFTTTLINLNLGFKLKLNNGWALKENSFFQPYLLASSGWTYASRASQRKGHRTDEDKGYVDLFGAAGINFRLGGGVSLFVQTGQHLPLKANLDGLQEQETSRHFDRFLQHSVGLTFNLGQASDLDEDNVPDRQDKCPNTPPGVEVDEHGCPIDGDADGVPDYLDACPAEAGSTELRGCPDKDNDGVTDEDDSCPDVAGKAELHGCPDTDNDGVLDQDDKCPDTPAGISVDVTGCPVAADQPAADTAVVVRVSRDTDGDGVADAQDHCPNTAGPAHNLGCPEIPTETRRILREATRAIRFEPSRATLLPSSYPTLNALVPILKAYSDYSLSIAGHTDSKGPNAANLVLSRERAAAARRYLLSKGVDESRVVLRGYGSLHPIAPNTTEAGRARNRRVEFDVFVSTEPNAAEVKYGPEPYIQAPATPAKPAKPVQPKKPDSRKTVLRRPSAPRKPAPKAPIRKRLGR